jgi:FkbM family methyltransferase
LKARLLLRARRHNLFWIQKPGRTFKELPYIIKNMTAFQELYDSLSDEESKDALIEALNLRILGPYYVRARVNTQEYWDRCHQLEADCIVKRNTIDRDGFPLCHHFVFPNGGRELSCHASTFGIGTTFFIEQYAYRTNQVSIAAQEGDVVIDGGGFLGETALYFAGRVARSGKVLTFEFNEETLGTLRENLRLNQELASHTEVVTEALWHQSGDALQYESRGPSTSVRMPLSRRDSPSKIMDASTTSIDDFVRDKALTRVDFIKLDIEGAELNALKGASETLRKFKPKLAIALYHGIQDFLEIPALLRSMDLGYQYHLHHAYVDDTETVLFAIAPDSCC